MIFSLSDLTGTLEHQLHEGIFFLLCLLIIPMFTTAQHTYNSIKILLNMVQRVGLVQFVSLWPNLISVLIVGVKSNN